MALREIVFDGPPTFELHLLEIPNGDGEPVRLGEWVDRGDGTWALRLEVPDALADTLFTPDYFAYQQSLTLSAQSDWSFYALIMAAMRKADTLNLARLRASFPDVATDHDIRLKSPGGLRASDPDTVKRRVLGIHWQNDDLTRRLR